MTLTPSQIEARLEQIEADLATRQNDFEKAAAEKYRLAREFELRHARAFVAASGSTATEKKAHATLALAAAEDNLWERMGRAEGEYEGLKAAVRTLETRSVIGMALLKSHGRNDFTPKPQWSRSAA